MSILLDAVQRSEQDKHQGLNRNAATCVRLNCTPPQGVPKWAVVAVFISGTLLGTATWSALSITHLRPAQDAAQPVSLPTTNLVRNDSCCQALSSTHH